MIPLKFSRLMIGRRIVLVFFVVFSMGLHSQSVVLIEGRISDADGVGLSGVHVVNKTLKIGRTSNSEGQFGLPVEIGDSVLFTHVGYKPLWYHVSDDFFATGNVMKICLLSDTVFLAETLIRPFPSTFSEFKSMATSLNLPEEKLPKVFEALSGPIYSGQGGIVMPGPVSILYALFSKESKQLKKMNEINHYENVRNVLYAKVSKDILFKSFKINSELELEFFLQSCQLTDEFVLKSSSFEIYEVLYSCYLAMKNAEK
jgi:hypothetical protein